MRLRSTQKLTVEEFPQEQKSWIAKLIGPLNDFMTQSQKILNDGIIFPDNYVGKEHVFEFTFQSAAISFPIGFQWRFAAAPKSFHVVYATEDGEPLNCSASWRLTEDGQVQLFHAVKFTTGATVTQFTTGSKYKIRVRVTP